MSLKVSAYFAASLDGYIAKRNGSIDWLNEASADIPKGEDCGYKAFMDSVDVLVMGRNTFEQVLTFGEWSYGDTPVVVLSSKPISIPAGLPNSVTHSSEAPKPLCTRLASEGAGHVYVDGGISIQRFLAEGLIDEIIITFIPIILGGGISPFGELEQEIKLVQLDAKVFDFGFMQARYSVES